MRLDVQQHLGGEPLGQEMVDQDQVGQQLAPGVVREHADLAGGAVADQRPQQRAVVHHEGGHVLALVRQRDLERQVRAVAPERPEQEPLHPLAGGQRGGLVQGGQLVVHDGALELGLLDRPERVDAPPRAVPEVARGVEELAVEVALGPQERHVDPPAPELAAPPLGPRGEVVRRGVERLHHIARDLVQQPVERLVPVGGVGQRVPDLPQQHRMPVAEHPEGVRTRHVAQDGRRVDRLRHSSSSSARRLTLSKSHAGAGVGLP